VRVLEDSGFETVFREQFPRLVSLGVVMSGRLDVAQELAQETLLRAHRRWTEVGEYDVPAAWLRKVMVNLLIDHHRRVRRERDAIDHAATDIRDAMEPPELDGWWDLVAPLPPRQRAIATLYYAEDLSVDEIAGTIGVTAGTVSASLWKARRSIARRLADEGSSHG
jgi:RNA polymerase sigma factor (sigma-70 family)